MAKRPPLKTPKKPPKGATSDTFHKELLGDDSWKTIDLSKKG